jgi:glycosyltransferase involved in cell wall biosynthesis
VLFSVIIPTFNRAGMLRRTLDTVWQQAFQDFETVVVDDGSTDGTVAYLRQLDGSVRVCSQANQGPGAARNLGARNTKGDYLAFLDSDDLWFDWTLASYAKIINEHHEPAFVAGKPFRFASEAELEAVGCDEVQSKSFADYYASGDDWRWWGASSFVVRRDVFEAVGGFTNEWVNGEDADLALRLGVARGFVQVTAPFTFGYREHDVSAMKNLDRTVAGIRQKIRVEQAGGYPGGPPRARERRRILTRHIRPVTLACLRHGRRRDAWELYRASFPWQAQSGRWKYLAGFLLHAFLARE